MVYISQVKTQMTINSAFKKNHLVLNGLKWPLLILSPKETDRGLHQKTCAHDLKGREKNIPNHHCR